MKGSALLWPGLTPRAVEELATVWLAGMDALDTLHVTDRDLRALAGRRMAAELIEHFARLGCPAGEIAACCHSVMARAETMLRFRDLLNGPAEGNA